MTGAAAAIGAIAAGGVARHGLAICHVRHHHVRRHGSGCGASAGASDRGGRGGWAAVEVEIVGKEADGGIIEAQLRHTPGWRGRREERHVAQA